jgi:hypothetical protein
VHHSRRGSDREEEKNGAKLTRGSLTVVGRRRRCAAVRSGRDAGRTRRKVLRPGLLPLSIGMFSSEHVCVKQRESPGEEWPNDNKLRRRDPGGRREARLSPVGRRRPGSTEGSSERCKQRRERERESRAHSPATRSLHDRQWPGGRGLHGGGVCAREGRCRDVHTCGKGKTGA